MSPTADRTIIFEEGEGPCRICRVQGRLFTLDAVEGVPIAINGHAHGVCMTCAERLKRSLQKWGGKRAPEEGGGRRREPRVLRAPA